MDAHTVTLLYVVIPGAITAICTLAGIYLRLRFKERSEKRNITFFRHIHKTSNDPKVTIEVIKVMNRGLLDGWRDRGRADPDGGSEDEGGPGNVLPHARQSPEAGGPEPGSGPAGSDGGVGSRSRRSA